MEFIGVSHINLTTINLLYSKPAASNYITLFDHISKPTTIFTMQDALKVTFDVVNTIMYLHKQNLYHCNLSCHTILIGADTKHILLSRWETTSITCKLHEEESIVLGKCGWESPESIILDHKGESSDIYAIGILLWYLMSHQLPFMEELKKMGGNKEQAVDTINRRIVNEEIRPNISIANINAYIIEFFEDSLAFLLFQTEEKPFPFKNNTIDDEVIIEADELVDGTQKEDS